MSVVLILGSGPNVIEARAWDRAKFDHILAINNAHAVRPDWDSMIHPEDFAQSRMPDNISANQTIVTAQDYVPAQNALGGFVYAGGTMAFTAGYWALYHLKPKVIAFIGCDMTYDSADQTHFYGTGTADPLRDDITLQSLEAKSTRLEVFGARHGCAMVNLSTNSSRLTFPRADIQAISDIEPRAINASATNAALEQEKTLGYYVDTGRYWDVQDQFDATAIRKLDALWLKATLAPTDTSRDT